MNENDIKKMRVALLDTMDEIHNICMKYNIKYFIVAGTALGAVRHNGFIPWDTDIDIAMLREDYDFFVKKANDFLNKNYYCASYHNIDNWCIPHALIYKKDTLITWNKNYYKNKKQCPIYIDLFAIDNMPNSIKERNIYENRIKKMIYYLGRRECLIYYHNNVITKIMKILFKNIHNIIYPNNQYNIKFDNILKMYSCQKCKNKGILSSPYTFERESLNDYIIGNPKLYDFENRKYFGYEHMDEYLKKLYGNYMELPPIEKRTENLNIIDSINFNI